MSFVDVIWVDQDFGHVRYPRWPQLHAASPWVDFWRRAHRWLHTSQASRRSHLRQQYVLWI